MTASKQIQTPTILTTKDTNTSFSLYHLTHRKLNAIEPSWATIKKWLRIHLFEFDTIEQGLMEWFGVK